MRERSGALAVLLLAFLLLAVAAPAVGAAQDEGPDGSGDPVDLGAYATPFVFDAPDGVTFELADGTRYTDTIEVLLDGDGLVLVNEVPMRAYVEGIAEMPAGWPLEALKAQAVAARTYAWFELRQGRWRDRGFDICATTSCQVFRGRDVVETPEVGERWARAVAETAGEVLLHEGRPILARYFSTSGGATRNNEHVFPSEGPRPYLKGIEDPDDAVSPLHRWTATFTREQLDRILSQGERLSAAVPVADVTHLTSPGGGSDRVRVTSADGTEVLVGASAFRAFVSSTAEELYPGTFPQDRPDGKPLPTTLPSSRFEVEVGEDAVVFHGRGWGHGVGMGQYGAMGKAERGLDYREILAAYYNGLEPVRAEGLPERIRVGLDTDAEEVTLSADGPFTVSTGGEVITDRALGPWRVELAADRTMRLLAPTGYGAPLVVAPTVASRSAPLSVEVVSLETVVNKASELRLVVTDRGSGDTVLARDLGIVAAGRHGAVWDLDDAEGRQVAAGAYDVQLVAEDEERVSGGEATVVEVRVPSPGDGGSLLSALPASVQRPLEPLHAGVAAALGVLFGLVGGRAVPVRS